MGTSRVYGFGRASFLAVLVGCTRCFDTVGRSRRPGLTGRGRDSVETFSGDSESAEFVFSALTWSISKCSVGFPRGCLTMAWAALGEPAALALRLWVSFGRAFLARL